MRGDFDLPTTCEILCFEAIWQVSEVDAYEQRIRVDLVHHRHLMIAFCDVLLVYTNLVGPGINIPYCGLIPKLKEETEEVFRDIQKLVVYKNWFCIVVGAPDMVSFHSTQQIEVVCCLTKRMITSHTMVHRVHQRL